MLSDTGVRQVRVNGVLHRVRPPTVREAVEVLDAMARIRNGDREAEFLFETHMENWFPAGLILDWGELQKFDQIKVLNHLLYKGMVVQKAREKAAGPPQWDDLLGLYCMVYGGDPWYVWNEVPFPFFMTMVGRADRQMARDTLSKVELFSLPHMAKGSGQVMARLRRRAGFVGTRTSTPEEIAAGRAALRADLKRAHGA